MRILLVEDDEVVSSAVETILHGQHYTVDTALDGQLGWELVESFNYDLIVLDVLLPRLDGIRFCHQFRAKDVQTPVLLLTAQNSSTDKVLGLDAGADDYVVKPFEPSEFLARVRALMRRRNSPMLPVLTWNQLRLDPSICEVTYDDVPLHLTPKEYQLLALFLRHHHRVFTRGAILDHLWASEESPGEDTVTVHIRTLRQKLKQVGAPADMIATVYGQGYRLKPVEGGLLNPPPDRAANHPDTAAEIKARLGQVWEKYADVSGDRVVLLQQAIAAWRDPSQPEILPEIQRQRAQQAAHQLAGMLGIFGFQQASQWAKDLELQFQAGGRLEPTSAAHSMACLAGLSQIFQ